MARPIIKLPKKGLWPKEISSNKSSVTLDVAKIDVDKILKNLGVLGEAVTYNVARALADALVSIMAYAQPRVPYYAGGPLGKKSTGALRESGEAVLYLDNIQKVIAKGNVDGTISTNYTGITKSAFSRKKPSWISGEIFYIRIEDGLDIALWTHENLLPYDQRAGKGKYEPAARSPGTGPKYLEVAFLQNKNDILGYMKEAINMTPDKLSAQVKKRGITGKFTVDEVDLVAKETSRSYFKGIQVKKGRK